MQPDGATTHAQGGFARHLGTGAGSIGAARGAFTTWLQQTAADPELLEDMAIVLSELASNAVEGADPERPGSEIRAEIADGVLEIVVSNRTPPRDAEVRRWDLDDTLRGGGRAS